MAQKMLIDATHPEETRVVVVEGSKVEEFDFESITKRQIAGNIYLAKVTRVEPSLQAAFVDYGGNRHGFLAFSEVHPDYYQIPVADREALMAEEAAEARADEGEDEDKRGPRKRRRPARGRARKPGEDAEAAADAATPSPDADPDLPDAEHAPPEDPSARASDEASDDAPPAGPHSIAETAGAEGDERVSEDPRGPAEPDDDGDEAEEDEVESIGGDDVEEERAPRRAAMRRYKIQEVIKVRQILLVQVVKEERGNKGAALTTYLSLPGRYCVLMPNTARGGGISRKITSIADRKKLKEIAGELEVPRGAGLIIRTAGSERTKAEIKRDYEYLMRQWDQVRELTLRSIAPTLIYEEGSLIKRAIRDLYTNTIDEVLVEGEAGHREARDYMKMLMPSHAGVVKHYTDTIPLFSRHQVESYLASMFNPIVQLKSGGYIVIGITEALVAIDVNSGRATREHSIEETALKTNLEAADEIGRQLRLRDLAGLIVIDFIDMEERRNNVAVEKRLKDKLRTDRARIQLGRISAFGLLEMSRQRLRPGMLEASTAPCAHCHGTGLIRSGESLALTILREVEEEGVRQRSKEVLVSAPVTVANYLINQKRDALIRIEGRYGLSVRVEAEPTLINPDYRLERFKVASRVIGLGGVSAPITVDTLEPEDLAEVVAEIVEDMVEADAETRPDATATSPARADEQPRKKRRRRRRRGGRDDVRGADAGGTLDVAGDEDEGDEDAADLVATEVPLEIAVLAEAAPIPEAEPVAEAKPKRPRARARRKQDSGDALTVIGTATDAASPTVPELAPDLGPEAAPGNDGATARPVSETLDTVSPTPDMADVPEGKAAAPKRAPRKRAPKKVAVEAPEAGGADIAASEGPAAMDGASVDMPVPAPESKTAMPRTSAPEPVPDPVTEVAQAAAQPAGSDPAAPAEDVSSKPKRRGWWSLGG